MCSQTHCTQIINQRNFFLWFDFFGPEYQDLYSLRKIFPKNDSFSVFEGLVR